MHHTNTRIQSTAAATSYGNHVPHVESGQHEAMLFTANTATIANKTGTQTRLSIHPASSGSKEMIQMNIYVIIAIGNRTAVTWRQ